MQAMMATGMGWWVFMKIMVMMAMLVIVLVVVTMLTAHVAGSRDAGDGGS